MNKDTWNQGSYDYGVQTGSIDGEFVVPSGERARVLIIYDGF